jgi:hypothetical protein
MDSATSPSVSSWPLAEGELKSGLKPLSAPSMDGRVGGWAAIAVDVDVDVKERSIVDLECLASLTGVEVRGYVFSGGHRSLAATSSALAVRRAWVGVHVKSSTAKSPLYISLHIFTNSLSLHSHIASIDKWLHMPPHPPRRRTAYQKRS